MKDFEKEIRRATPLAFLLIMVAVSGFGPSKSLAEGLLQGHGILQPGAPFYNNRAGRRDLRSVNDIWRQQINLPPGTAILFTIVSVDFWPEAEWVFYGSTGNNDGLRLTRTEYSRKATEQPYHLYSRKCFYRPPGGSGPLHLDVAARVTSRYHAGGDAPTEGRFKYAIKKLKECPTKERPDPVVIAPKCPYVDPPQGYDWDLSATAWGQYFLSGGTYYPLRKGRATEYVQLEGTVWRRRRCEDNVVLAEHAMMGPCLATVPGMSSANPRTRPGPPQYQEYCVGPRGYARVLQRK